MDFRILGPLEALDGGRVVGLGGARQRALLRGDRERAERLQSEADAAYRELGMKV